MQAFAVVVSNVTPYALDHFQTFMGGMCLCVFLYARGIFPQRFHRSMVCPSSHIQQKSPYQARSLCIVVEVIVVAFNYRASYV